MMRFKNMRKTRNRSQNLRRFVQVKRTKRNIYARLRKQHVMFLAES